MLGALAAGASRYVACEPAQRTYIGLCALAKAFEEAGGTIVELHRVGCEDFSPQEGCADVALTVALKM